jgi:hypothetical protein
MYGYRFSIKTNLWCYNSLYNVNTAWQQHERKKSDLTRIRSYDPVRMSRVCYHKAKSPNGVLVLIYSSYLKKTLRPHNLYS